MHLDEWSEKRQSTGTAVSRLRFEIILILRELVLVLQGPPRKPLRKVRVAAAAGWGELEESWALGKLQEPLMNSASCS